MRFVGYGLVSLAANECQIHRTLSLKEYRKVLKLTPGCLLNQFVCCGQLSKDLLISIFTYPVVNLELSPSFCFSRSLYGNYANVFDSQISF